MLIMQFWTTGMHIDSRGEEPEVEEGGCIRVGQQSHYQCVLAASVEDDGFPSC